MRNWPIVEWSQRAAAHYESFVIDLGFAGKSQKTTRLGLSIAGNDCGRRFLEWVDEKTCGKLVR